MKLKNNLKANFSATKILVNVFVVIQELFLINGKNYQWQIHLNEEEMSTVNTVNTVNTKKILIVS